MKGSTKHRNGHTFVGGFDAVMPIATARSAESAAGRLPTAGLAGRTNGRSLEPSISEPKPAPTHEQIERRAYEIFLARQGQDGDAVTDWLRAERELTSAE